MGELPPLHTPQGPGVPRALRPRFPRVDSSGTSRVPSSRSASFPFLASGSLHFAHLLSPGELPPPSRSPLPPPSFPFLASSSLRFSPRSDTASSTDLSALVHSCSSSASIPFFPFLASGSRRSLHFVLHAASGFVSSPFRAYLFGMVPLPRLCFPLLSPSLRPVLSSSVTFSSASPQLPPASFPFLPFPFVQFSPVLSTLVRFVLPPSSRPLGVPTLPRSPSGSRVPPPLFRGSVSVARGSRRSAPTPLHRSGKSNRNGSDT